MCKQLNKYTLCTSEKREQAERCSDGKTLSDYVDITSLNHIRDKYNSEKINRIQMIDVVWLSKNKKSIYCVFEVENTTGFTSAIQRASNIEADIPKIMVIPDSREAELRKIRDPLFLNAFFDNNWKYITYSDVEHFFAYSKSSLDKIFHYSKTLPVSEDG